MNPDAMVSCDEIREDIALCALGTLEAEESARVRAHAATCPACREELVQAEESVHLLALAAPRVRAPAAMRRTVMDSVRGETTPGDTPIASHVARPRPWLARGAAIAAAAAVIGLGVWNLRLQGQVNSLRGEARAAERRDDGLVLFAVPSSIRGEFRPVMPDTPAAAAGAVTWSPDRGECYAYFDRLPPPRAGTTYRLWYIVDGGQFVVDAGELTPDAAGRAQAWVDAGRWRGVTYDLLVREEHRPHDDSAPAVLSARLVRPTPQ